MIFIILSVISLPGLFFALGLPKTTYHRWSEPTKKFFAFPSPFNAITFISAFLIDGIVVVSLGLLFLKYKADVTPIVATILAAFYLGYRRICLLIFSPAGGWLADRFGLNKIFVWSLVLTIIGLIFLSQGYVETGATIIFTFYGIQSAMAPANASKENKYKLRAIAENATWRDIGAATGTLMGGFLLLSSFSLTMILIATFALIVLLLYYLNTIQQTIKIIFTWK
jgi:MFS family permease